MNRFACCLILLFFSLFVQAKPLSPEKVPEPLKPWIDWVSEQQPERDCPFLYTLFEQKYCSWATELNLELSVNKGVFSGRWQVFKETWIHLVGDSKHWPLSVTVNGKTALVMDRRDGLPAIKLDKGIYEIKGEFLWESIPDNLALPNGMGLVNLRMNGQPINAPLIKDGQLWLKDSDRGQVKPENVQNRVELQVFRKVIDDVPLQVLTRLILDVSGEQREEKLTGALLDGFIPIALACPLPARLEANGQLVMQVRAGHWSCEVLGRSGQIVDALSLPKEREPEIWVFDARPSLRVVEIEQLNTIDASQTNLPDEWRNLPAYKMNAEQVMRFKTIRRGDPEPEPNQLNLTRRLWLDFDGAGYTVNDNITGTMSSGWRLNALPDTKLGRVSLDGNSQLITQQGTDNIGVEVRKGNLQLDADSRLVGDVAHLSAVGWQQDFRQVNAELNLPAGWRLLAATGVDNVPDSWIARWTLLDLFLVLMTALATGRLWNRYWGGLALVTLIIIWHEADAPHFVWLHILAATALLSVLPQGKFFAVIHWYRRACWLMLLAITLPFMVDQVRIGLYPQLENPSQDIYQDSSFVSGNRMPMAMPPAAPAPAEAGFADEEQDQLQEANKPAAKTILRKEMKRATREMLSSAQSAYDSNRYDKKSAEFNRVDPKAKVQTGPGLPQWQWHKVNLSWNGTVDASQQIHLWYLSPTGNLLLNFLRVLLLTLLVLLMIGSGMIPPAYLEKIKSVNKATPLLLCLFLLPLLPSQKTYADTFPDNALLEQLRTRLQEQVIPDCLPACAHIQQMKMLINDKEVHITLQIHAQESVVLPLPADYGQWFPHQVSVDGKAADALYRANNALWIHLKQGEHEVVLRGIAPALSKFSLPLPLKPKRVEVEQTGWDLVGLHENGWADEQLQFSRVQASQTDKNKPMLEQGALPPFVRIERTLQLGLDWRVTTQITRLSPADSAIVFAVPLLKGESVASENIRVKNELVEVNMTAQQTTMQWQSVLERSDKITLSAPDSTQWTEVWRVDISPIWHLESTGLAMIHLDNTGQWLPEWHPFPNETVSLNISRPESVIGQTLTIDSSNLTVTQGQRMRDVVLRASLRSSQGMQQTVTLPENAQLQSVAIDGRTQPLRLEGQKLTLPINPTKQEVSITWQEPTTVSLLTRLSTVDLGSDSVNSNLSLSLAQDRWVLLAFGPSFGPIILFWATLVVILLLSVILGKITLTPLKNWQWFLLLVGLSQLPMAAAGLVVAWLMLLGWRASQNAQQRFFNALQVALALLSLISLSVLFTAVAQGLLNTPDMQVTGNRSSAFVLNWYQDRSLATLPSASVLSLPLIVYRLLMLAWALWLASALLSWLKWGWGCFASNGLWHKKVKLVQEEQTAKTD